jgi:hypothetical protein
MNSRRDTDYWRDNSENQNITPSFMAIVQSWLGASQNNLADEIKKYDTSSFFPLISWQILFAGYGVFPPSESLMPQNKTNQSVNMKELDDFIRRCGSNYGPHLEFINTLTPF